jgi:hypothetical protein
MSKTNKQEVARLPGGGFRGKDGVVHFFVPAVGESLTWKREDQQPVELSASEQHRAELLHYDLEKVLIVKKWLCQGRTPTAINRGTGVSRNTVYLYKKIYDEKYTKNTAKYTESTKNSTGVLFILLTSNWFALDSADVLLGGGIIVVALLLNILLELHKKSKEQKTYTHRDEVRELKRDFYTVLDWSYKREPIIVGSKKEEAHKKDMLKYYKNSGRLVLVFPKKIGEDNRNYFFRKRQFMEKLVFGSEPYVQKGQQNHKAAFNKINEANLLAYFTDPSAIKSKAFLLEFTAYYRNHREPAVNINATNKTIDWGLIDAPENETQL